MTTANINNNNNNLGFHHPLSPLAPAISTIKTGLNQFIHKLHSKHDNNNNNDEQQQQRDCRRDCLNNNNHRQQQTQQQTATAAVDADLGVSQYSAAQQQVLRGDGLFHCLRAVALLRSLAQGAPPRLERHLQGTAKRGNRLVRVFPAGKERKGTVEHGTAIRQSRLFFFYCTTKRQPVYFFLGGGGS